MHFQICCQPILSIRQHYSIPFQMECQVEKKLHFRHLLLFHLNGQENASEAARNICKVYGEEAITERTAQKWFQKFREGILEFENYRNDGAKLLNKVETISLIDLLWNISLNKQ